MDLKGRGFIRTFIHRAALVQRDLLSPLRKTSMLLVPLWLGIKACFSVTYWDLIAARGCTAVAEAAYTLLARSNIYASVAYVSWDSCHSVSQSDPYATACRVTR